MSREIISVSQVNEYIRAILDEDAILSAVAIRGEVSNYKVYPSGHHYFTLKDENASLKCVMFKFNTVRLRFRPENGSKIIAIGRISAYPRDGAYQLYCTTIINDGTGDLYAAFEQLKTRLAAAGLFDTECKKPLPAHPKTIGIVTSSAGAAIHDILKILRVRYPLAQVKLLPVRVQGVEAPEEIANAIRLANALKLADVLIVGRGGGSIEDLWAFNDEQVATAIYESEIPVISAVGHEPDVTISDYVADVRAATPTNGAELAVPDITAIYQQLDGLTLRLHSAFTKKVSQARTQLQTLISSPSLRSPKEIIEKRDQQLQTLNTQLLNAQQRLLASYKQTFSAYAAKLDAMSPLKVLSRGYSLTTNVEGRAIRSVKDVAPGEGVTIVLSDGSLRATVQDIEENDYE